MEKDFKTQLPPNTTEITILDNKGCPKCASLLVVLPPDRVWCTSCICTYGELHIVGKGVYEQEKFFKKMSLDSIGRIY